MKDRISYSFKEAVKYFTEFSEDQEMIKNATEIVEKIVSCFRAENKILICGNGGSATDAMHFAEEFTGKFRKERKALPVISLTDPSHITCVGNDYGFKQIFARGVEAFGKAGDILIGISTSGNSENVIEALQKGKEFGLVNVGILGKDGGAAKEFCDHTIIAPGKTTDRIQEIHIMILHTIIENVERNLFPENYK